MIVNLFQKAFLKKHCCIILSVDNSGVYLICPVYAICFLSNFSIIILVTHQTLKVLNTALKVCKES